MILSHGNRLYLRRFLRSRAPKFALFLFCVINLVDVLRIHHSIASADVQPAPAPSSRPRERIYIACMHFNNGYLLEHHWNNALLDLAKLLGPDNVFVNVYESGSWDHTKPMLMKLDAELERMGVPHRVEVSDVTHLDEMANEDKSEGWITTPDNKRELRRIPYLARLRNKTLKDLLELYKEGITFDKVLFLNDVIFTTDDVFKLLETNGGDYAAACSLDFALPPLYYDTFALRDSDGQAHMMQTWPYFKSSESRNALVNHLDAVPVSSCWNGIVAMPAEPFTSSSKLRFRAVSDSLAAHHVEGSECCLIHADNPLSKTHGVYLNPRVRVGYTQPAYDATHPTSHTWVTPWSVFSGLWINRLKRWLMPPIESWIVRHRLAAWARESPSNHEVGDFCLINEMQVLAEAGWAHV